jgi:hypothetical protein
LEYTSISEVRVACIITNVLGFRDYIFAMISSDKPVISFGTREIGKKNVKIF